MKNNTKLALYVSLFVFIGFLIIFFILSLVTGQWNYLLVSIPSSFLAGLTGLMVTIHQIKKDRNNA